MTVRAVFFDVGETLIDESRLWRGWAAYLGVREEEFVAVLEDVIAQGQHHHRAFDRFRPGFDLEAARRERTARGDSDIFAAADLYPDAARCLRELRDLGYLIGVAGNQPEGAVTALRSLGLGADFIASSATMGAQKPSPEFFTRLIAMAGVAPRRIVYVGDRLDNDIMPARDAGMATAFLHRGPWARFQQHLPEAVLATMTLRSLDELPAALSRCPSPQ